MSSSRITNSPYSSSSDSAPTSEDQRLNELAFKIQAFHHGSRSLDSSPVITKRKIKEETRPLTPQPQRSTEKSTLHKIHEVNSKEFTGPEDPTKHE